MGISRRISVVALAALVLAALGACSSSEPEVVRLATTTSTYDSGLLQALLPAFESRTGVRVDILAVGTGQALALGRSGDADVLLVHAPDLEMAFVAAGDGLERIPIMYNDFVLLGPYEDPAGVRAESEAHLAFRKIAAQEQPFVSRGDSSGTHTKELDLWEQAGLQPDPNSGWYASIGQGMGATLIFADQKGAYTLADRGTFLAMRARLSNLDVIVGGQTLAENSDRDLLNPYGLILVNPDRHPGVNLPAARQFAEWLASLETQMSILEFGADTFGQPLFYPDSLSWRESGR